MSLKTELTKSSLHAPELTDEDVYEAMGELPGYLDITTDDFRELYRLAYLHAIDRLVGRLHATDLMRGGPYALRPGQTLAEAVHVMAEERLKSMPVTDNDNKVIGVLSETDILRWLGATSFADLLHRPALGLAAVDAQLHDADVGSVMTRPAIAVQGQASFAIIMQAFREMASPKR